MESEVREAESIRASRTLDSRSAAIESPRSNPNPKTLLIVSAFAAFLATFNETFLNVGFAPMMASLNVDVSTIQWLATAYMLGAAVMVPVSAFAYRSFPTRPLFCATTLLLVIGSVVGALAQSFPVLLIGRIIQALGTGMLIPIGMNITLEAAPREKLGTYMGIMGAMTTLGPSSSVILAGLILAFAPWPMLLWVFGGLSALCFLSGLIFLRDVAYLTHPRLDVVSVVLISIALIGILYGVSTLFSGSLWVALAAIIVGAIALVLFVYRQNSLEEPLINLRPLSVAPFSVGVICNMLALLAIFAMNIIVPTFMQSMLQTPALTASLILFPAILCSCAISPLAGRIFDKHGIGVLLPLGFICIAVFSVLTCCLVATSQPVVLALVYIPVICGSALIIGPVQSFALSRLRPEENPHGVTIMSTGFQIAGCIGSSVFTGVYAAATAMAQVQDQSVLSAASTGMITTGVVIGVCMLVGLGLSLYLRRAEHESTTAIVETNVPTILETIMKTDVYTLKADDCVLDAMKLFSDKKISGVPVIDDQNRVTGFVTDGDVMRCLADQVPAFKTAWSFIIEQENEDFDETLRAVVGLRVGSIATKHVITVAVDDDLGSITRVLVDNHLKKAPVIEDGKMVGIINRSNITRYSIDHYLASLSQTANAQTQTSN